MAARTAQWATCTLATFTAPIECCAAGWVLAAGALGGRNANPFNEIKPRKISGRSVRTRSGY
jgi:hypothetical protein